MDKILWCTSNDTLRGKVGNNYRTAERRATRRNVGTDSEVGEKANVMEQRAKDEIDGTITGVLGIKALDQSDECNCACCSFVELP